MLTEAIILALIGVFESYKIRKMDDLHKKVDLLEDKLNHMISNTHKRRDDE